LDLDQLAEKIRRGGVPDQPWQLLTPEGDRVAFCGSSIFALITAAKTRGVYKRRKPTIDRGAVRKLAAEGVVAAEIARRMSIGRASVYRLLH
jgi:hypothetical protein